MMNEIVGRKDVSVVVVVCLNGKRQRLRNLTMTEVESEETRKAQWGGMPLS
jgi:hypothetical protein